MTTSKDLYLDLLRDTLTGETYNDGCVARRSLRHFFRRFGIHLGRATTPNERKNGRVWPETALTMAGKKRLDNIRYCLETCDAENVSGDYVECGIWRGGSAIYAAGVIKANESQRWVWGCDSFTGLPAPMSKIDLIDPVRLYIDSDVLAVNYSTVVENFKRFGLFDSVSLITGDFSQLNLTLPVKKIAVLRLDGDMYKSTRDSLALYDRVSRGGFVIVDDYYVIDGCRRAVDEFCVTLPEMPRLKQIDYASVFFRHEETPSAGEG